MKMRLFKYALVLMGLEFKAHTKRLQRTDFKAKCSNGDHSIQPQKGFDRHQKFGFCKIKKGQGFESIGVIAGVKTADVIMPKTCVLP